MGDNVNGLGCQWFATIGGLGRQRLRVLVPRPVGWGGATLEFWQYDRRREAVAGAAALVSRQWSPPPNVAENNNNMTFRRIYNKMKIICDIFYQVPHASTRSLLLST